MHVCVYECLRVFECVFECVCVCVCVCVCPRKCVAAREREHENVFIMFSPVQKRLESQEQKF